MAEVKREPMTFEFTCDGPAWKGVPVVNGHAVPASAIDVHIDPKGFPEVTLRFPAADALKLGFDPAVLGVDEGTREALVSLGWTPPDVPIPPEPAAEGVTLEPREHAYPAGGILSVGSEPVTP